MKPLVFDLCAGLGGWSEAFIDQGYRAVGFDIEAHDYGKGGYPGELVLRDIRSITGAELVREYGVPNVIVSSPPCQEFSYMAMPWSKAKEKRRKILADTAEQARLKDLFNQCFRIQREVSDAAGRYVPLIVENVRGAQEWVGKAKWNFGSFYLWGDVPALMPIPGKVRKTPEGSWDKTRKNYNPDHTWDGNKMGASPGKVWSDRPANVAAHRELIRSEGNKTVGMNWSDQSKRGQDFTRIAGNQAMEGTKGVPHRPSGHWTNPAEHEGRKQGGDWWGPKDRKTSRARLGSRSKARKEASAMIAKIPKPLAEWIARCFLTVTVKNDKE